VTGIKYVDVDVKLSWRTSVTFQVRTAKDAHVGLTAEQGVYTENNMYELVLGAGNNTYSCLR